MNSMKRLARLAAATILATGIFAATTAAPSDAAPKPGTVVTFDTGW